MFFTKKYSPYYSPFLTAVISAPKANPLNMLSCQSQAI